MYNIEIHNLICRINDIFYKSGVWQLQENATLFRKNRVQLLYLTILLSFLTSIIVGAIVNDDNDESIFLTALATGIVVVILKYCYIFLKRDEILGFLNDICYHSVETREEFINVSNKLESFVKLAIWFPILSLMGIAFFIILSLPAISNERNIPFNIWFPWSWEDSATVYWIAFVYDGIGLIISSCCSVFTITIWYLMTNCSIKYQVLGNRLRSMGTHTTIKMKKSSESELQKMFLQEFIDAIKTHQSIQMTIDRFKSSFSNLFFAQMTTSGICICGCTYAIAFSSSENLLRSSIYMVALFYNFFDIFTVMYFGNEIKLSSDRLSYCLFESNWIVQSKICKKCIIISTEVFKRPHELVIGKLYPLDLETFTSILNLAYRMLNILKSFK